MALGIGTEDPTAALGAIGAFSDYTNMSNAGGTLVRGARATRLRMDGTRCVGVEIEREGKAESVDARAVVLCDGGFQSNNALLRERAPGQRYSHGDGARAGRPLDRGRTRRLSGRRIEAA